jgi:hypothetical protein
VAGFFMRGRVGGMKRFSLSNALLLTAIIALALGWWLDHRRLAIRCNILNRELNMANLELGIIKGFKNDNPPSAHY